jgi:hypothetical protein
VDLSDLLQTIVIYRKLPTFDTEKALNEGNGVEPCQALLLKLMNSLCGSNRK